MILSWLWILAWSPICSGQAGPTIRVEQVEGVKKVSVSIKEGTAVDTLLVDLTQLFSFPGVERQFSLQASALELIKVSDEGAVTLSKPVDYEELCQTNVKPCTFQSKIAVLPQDVFESVLFKVEVLNENDNAPRFESSSVSVAVNENQPAGQRIEIPELVAFDADVDDAKSLRYELTPHDLFDIENEDGRTFLVPKKSLDREQVGYLTGIVEVSDRGGRKAQADLDISIADANDNPPLFKEDTFEIEILEGRPVGSLIFTAEAFDADIGVNAEIKYKIVGAQPIQAKYLFEIEPESGRVISIKHIKRQDFAMVRLKIKASDAGSPSLSSECDVLVKILDENDHDPRITLTPLYPSPSNTSVAVVNENEPVGSFVVWVKVMDQDFDANGETDVSIQPEEIFQMQPDDGVIISKRQFDREQRATYKLTVTACDKGTPKRCSSVSMDVEIGDVNDNAPKMEQKIIRANFRENISVQSKLLSIYATDADDMEGFGKLTYSIMGGSGVFDIDQTTGQLILSDELDYEMEKSYQLTITASDPEGLSDETTVEVTVLNVNDNLPVIDAPEVIKMKPGFDITTPIALIHATDADGLDPILKLSGMDASLFTLVRGELFVMANVTRDFNAQLTILAIDLEDGESQVEQTILVVASRDWSAVGAGIACGFLMFLIVIVIGVFRNCSVRRYKLYDRMNQQKNSAVNRTDELLKHSSESIGKNSISLHSEKEMASLLEVKPDGSSLNHSIPPKFGVDSDSGRGESSSETHSRKHDSSTVLGQWCQAECLTLGHSDACWLPRGATENHFIVEVTPNSQRQPTALSVWEETSDYSSHNEAESMQNSKLQITTRQPTVAIVNNQGVIV